MICFPSENYKIKLIRLEIHYYFFAFLWTGAVLGGFLVSGLSPDYETINTRLETMKAVTNNLFHLKWMYSPHLTNCSLKVFELNHWDSWEMEVVSNYAPR